MNKNTVVVTQMSNLGLEKYLNNLGIEVIRTKVGDRYVLEEMLKNGYNLGGEQSGHVILLDYNPTGDGILTSLMLIQAILESGKKASELSGLMQKYPQVLINVKVKEEAKGQYENDGDVTEVIQKIETELAGEGRVLIRPSGTEALIRVMIEGLDQDDINKKAKKIADVIEKKFGV